LPSSAIPVILKVKTVPSAGLVIGLAGLSSLEEHEIEKVVIMLNITSLFILFRV
jgi:hypothetical protein